MINFIGLGAQKSGTSWVYACLYEHPEICSPIKEIHFFSRERFNEGKDWYESHFKKCRAGLMRGEFSTSYLYSEETPERIRALYPEAKLIVILRNPIDRAYSQYTNAIKAGEIQGSVTAEEYFKSEPSSLLQGKYTAQLERYYTHFPNDQILVLIYEDSKRDPVAFIKRIYEFIGVDTTFVPSMLMKEVNVARVPRTHHIDSLMHRVAEAMRHCGLDRVVWMIRKLGLPDLVRAFNTKAGTHVKDKRRSVELIQYFKEDVQKLSTLLGRNLTHEWDI